jgi:hypothetical protein
MKGTPRKPGAPVHIISGRERLLLPKGDFSAPEIFSILSSLW